MTDPLAEVVELLRPGAPFSKLIGAAGSWRVHRSDHGRQFYCLILEGTCRLTLSGAEPLTLVAGDFALIPSAEAFTMSSLERSRSESTPVQLPDGEYRLGTPGAAPELRALIGYCEFGSPDASLLVSLLPRFVHVRGDARLRSLVELVKDESSAQRPARDVVLRHLLEVLLIEALRSTSQTEASPGLVRGLADEQLRASIRRMHEAPNAPWTVVQLAKEASLSRSAFFARFTDAVGVPPMEYLLAWRMALAKRYLRKNGGDVGEVAERVGYSSASTFSVAFRRYVGVPPGRYARIG